MRDALKNYLTLASGLTEVGRQRAMAAAKALVAQGEATAEQVGNIAEDLMETSKTNREMITTLVRTEVEKALNNVGLATADSVERLTKRLQALESALREASGGTGADAAGEDVTTSHELAEPAKKAAAKTAKPAAKPAAKAAKPAAKPAAQQAPAKTAAKPTAKKPAKKAQS